MENSILIFKRNDEAYSSYRFFAEQLGDAFEVLGYKIEYFDMKVKSLDDLEKLSGKEYLAVFDFNSKLPGAVLDDDSFFLDSINAPFYNYILDHPIYHHRFLQAGLKNYNVICVDEYHSEYIRRFYKNIKTTFSIPVGATQINCEDFQFKKKENDKSILFSASYLNPKDYGEIIKELPLEMKRNVSDTIDILLGNTSYTFEKAAEMVYENTDKRVKFIDFANSVFLADIYVRALFRQKVLENIIKTGLNVNVCGENYEKSTISDCKNVKILGQFDYKSGLSLMSMSDISVNVMPWFKSGIHDRVLNAMINKTVCVTDKSELLEKNFTENNDYIAYSLNEISNLPDILLQLVSDRSQMDMIRENAYKKAKQMTFKELVKQIPINKKGQ